jgi:hypothetical protein
MTLSVRHAVSVRPQVEEFKFTDQAHGPKTASDVETTILVRECIAARANDWPDLHERLGLNMPKEDEHVTDSPVELVKTIFHLEDLVASRAAARSQFQAAFHWNYFSSSMKQWAAEEKQAEAALHSYRFDYDTAKERCAKGSTDLAYDCMARIGSMYGLADSVKRRIDARDLSEHLGRMSSKYIPDAVALTKEIAKLDKVLKTGNYQWTRAKKSCRKLLAEEVKAIQQRVLNELSAGEAQEDGACHEKEDKMCSEGTYTTNQRRWNHKAGAAAFSAGYLISKFTLMPLGGAIGTAIMGPAGAVVGALAANAFVAPLATGAGFWASRGPLECACFPRECIYSNETKTCVLDAPAEETATKNPFGNKLPMAGMKCALNYKSEDECELQQCSQEDYSQTISHKSNLWGIAGHKGKNLYNCLAVSQSPSGMLAVSPTLLDGKPNTIEERNKLFSEFPN